MRLVPILGLIFASTLSGCAVLFPVADVVTMPLDRSGRLEEAHDRYTSNIRFGLFEDAATWVEPAVKPRFKSEIHRLRDLRFSDVRTESIEFDTLEARARVVVYRGYWLSSPFEREIRAVQHWRRDSPRPDWYVSPDFDSLLTPNDLSNAPIRVPPAS